MVVPAFVSAIPLLLHIDTRSNTLLSMVFNVTTYDAVQIGGPDILEAKGNLALFVERLYFLSHIVEEKKIGVQPMPVRCSHNLSHRGFTIGTEDG